MRHAPSVQCPALGEGNPTIPITRMQVGEGRGLYPGLWVSGKVRTTNPDGPTGFMLNRLLSRTPHMLPRPPAYLTFAGLAKRRRCPIHDARWRRLKGILGAGAAPMTQVPREADCFTP